MTTERSFTTTGTLAVGAPGESGSRRRRCDRLTTAPETGALLLDKSTKLSSSGDTRPVSSPVPHQAPPATRDCPRTREETLRVPGASPAPSRIKGVRRQTPPRTHQTVTRRTFLGTRRPLAGRGLPTTTSATRGRRRRREAADTSGRRASRPHWCVIDTTTPLRPSRGPYCRDQRRSAAETT